MTCDVHSILDRFNSGLSLIVCPFNFDYVNFRLRPKVNPLVLSSDDYGLKPVIVLDYSIYCVVQ
jgi:hypothetical protein